MNNDKNYRELWESIVKEQEAKLEQLDAEKRMERVNVLDEMKKRFDATTDWTEAKWDEFVENISDWYDGE